MALTDGWPAQTEAADQIEIRKGLAGLIIRDTSGNARAGVFPRHTNALVSARSDMKVDVAAFEAAAVRAGGPVFMANDGTVQVDIDAAPVANSRYDVVYYRQKEDGYGGLADGSNGPTFGVQKGAASATPNKATVLAAIPAGAVPMASLLIPSTATATNSVGVVITQEFPYTALTGGAIWVRTASDLSAVTGYAADVRAWAIDTKVEYRYDGSAWKAWESDWITYTATLSNLAVGTGGSAAASTRYRWVEGEIEVSMRFVLGSSGASVGTNPAASLPVTVTSPAHAGALYAPFSMYDTSGSASRFGFAVADSTANYVRFYQMTAAFAQAFDSITATSPWTWAAGDVIAARFMVSPA